MLQARLKDWPNWGLDAEPRLVRTFSNGRNHQTALIESASKQYVLKIFDGPGQFATSAQQWAGKLGLSPAIIYADKELTIMDFISDLGHGERSIASLAKSLSSLHSAPAPDWPRFNLLDFCDQYLMVADSRIQQWHTELLPGLQIFLDDSTAWCPCHNDLVQENCLYDGKQVQLIDWEYAMLNNPWFDIGAVTVYFDLDPQQTTKFLNDYVSGWQHKVDQAIYYAAQLAVLWCDLLWHIEKYSSDYIDQQQTRFKRLRSIAAKLSIELPKLHSLD